MVTSYIGIGSNVGNRQSNIRTALQELKRTKNITIQKTSSFYQTEPQGGPEGQPWFLNGVVRIETSLSPSKLLERLHEIEQGLKRKRTVKNGPRTIDLDILTYGKRVVARPRLFIPHPLLCQREFVLKGFCELAPDFVHPLLRKSIHDIYETLKEKNRS
jgi:2-amino-4-hydroxy-6-hydroxymethyldihydropteridine diphosphokinase